MATRIGIGGIIGGSYELAYDIIGRNIAGNYTRVRLYGILHITNAYINWTRGSASVHTSGLQPIGTYYSRGDYTVVYRDFNFAHNAQGKFSAYIGASLSTTYTSVNCGGILTLPDIPRQANITGSSNFNDEQNPTIYFNNPGAFRINARLEFGGTSIRRDNIPNTGSYTFNLTDEERDLLREKCTGNTMNVRFTLATCIGGTAENYWSYHDRVMSIVNANPILGEWSYCDTNPITVALTGSDKKFINEYSNVTATISNEATPLKKSTISKYRLSNGSNFVEDTNYKNELTLNNITTSTMILTVYDSRGNSSYKEKKVDKNDFIEYQKPYLTEISAERIGDTTEDVILKFKGKFWNGNFGLKNNHIEVSYRFKKSFESEYKVGITELKPVIEGNDFSCEMQIAGDLEASGFSLDENFIIEIVINDELTKNLTNDTILSAGSPAIAFYGNCVSIGSAYDESKGGRVQIFGVPIEEYIKEIMNNKET